MNYNINYISTYTSTEKIESKNHYFKFIYIVNGCKDITINNNCIRYYKNEILYIKKNCSFSFINIPTENMYEEIEFTFTKEELTIIMNKFITKYGYEIFSSHIPEGKNENIISQNADRNLTSYFDTLIELIKDEFISSSEHIEWVKRAEFIFHIVNSTTKYISNNTIYDIKFTEGNLVDTVTRNTYNKVTLNELADMCDMSLSTFKKEFINYFNTPPHRWFITQRLNHARFLLISTNKEIREISKLCCFDNISHFIKLFKTKFDCTPLNYRYKVRNEHTNEPFENESE